MKKLCVIGSINMDLVARVERFPSGGETVLAGSFETFPGGKGANQAVSAARLGADVLLVGKVGDDLFGGRYLDVLKAEGVRTEGVGVEGGVSTGVALIEVERSGENRIVLAVGANGSVTPSYIEGLLPLLDGCDVVLLQLEVPIDTVVEACRRGRALGKTVILDPAPVVPLPADLYRLVDYITPNEHELERLTGGAGIEGGIEELLRRGCRAVVVKAGGEGSYYNGGGGTIHIPAFPVEVVDTTAAGDCFNAAFATMLARGDSAREALTFANAAGALCATGMGAQGAMPTLEAVRAFMESARPQ